MDAYIYHDQYGQELSIGARDTGRDMRIRVTDDDSSARYIDFPKEHGVTTALAMLVRCGVEDERIRLAISNLEQYEAETKKANEKFDTFVKAAFDVLATGASNEEKFEKIRALTEPKRTPRVLHWGDPEPERHTRWRTEKEPTLDVRYFESWGGWGHTMGFKWGEGMGPHWFPLTEVID